MTEVYLAVVDHGYDGDEVVGVADDAELAERIAEAHGLSDHEFGDDSEPWAHTEEEARVAFRWASLGVALYWNDRAVASCHLTSHHGLRVERWEVERHDQCPTPGCRLREGHHPSLHPPARFSVLRAVEEIGRLEDQERGRG